MKKIAESVQFHLHDDFEVTVERLNNFANSPREVQLQVIAELRQRAGNDWAAVELAITAIVLSLAGAILIPSLPLTATDDLMANAIRSIVIVALVFAGLLPTMIPAMRGHNTKSCARVWLGAYGDELSRRHTARGRLARRWRRMH